MIQSKIKGGLQSDCRNHKVGDYPKFSHFFLTEPRNLQTGIFFSGGGASQWVSHASSRRCSSQVFSLEFVTKGAFRFEQDGQAGVAETGDLFVVRRHADNDMECLSETAEKKMLKLDGPMLSVLLHGLNLAGVNILHPRSPEKISRLFDRIFRTIDEKKPAFELSLLAVELLFTIAEECKVNALPPPAVKMSEYLEQRVYDVFNLEAMSHHFAMSKSTLLRHFHGYFHTTPGAYHKRLRLETAQYLLRNEAPLSIKQIAQQLGYSSPFHFSSEFTRHAGVSPKAWRAKYK